MHTHITVSLAKGPRGPKGANSNHLKILFIDRVLALLDIVLELLDNLIGLGDLAIFAEQCTVNLVFVVRVEKAGAHSVQPGCQAHSQIVQLGSLFQLDPVPLFE